MPPRESPNGGPATSPSTHQTLSLSKLAAALSGSAKEAFQEVFRQSQESGLAVHLVGGPVRDAILGAPVKDLDFAVEGDAVELARVIAGRSEGELVVHPRFGTATVSVSGARVDLITARRETYRSPGQLPDVTPGTIEEDLGRRDFTINAMAMPLTDGEAVVLDPFGGEVDLREGVVRILHAHSLADDPTRMFRAVRYEQRFGFTIEAETMVRMGEAISAGHMAAVSGDRWRHELEKVLDEPDPGPALRRAVEAGVLAGIHLGWKDCPGLRRLSEIDGRSVGPMDWLGALFSHLSVEEGNGAIRRLRLAGPMADVARDTMLLRDAEAEVMRAASRPSELYRVLSRFEPAAVACWTNLTSEPSLRRALHQYSEELRFVRPELTGGDLVAMGVPQGPLVGRLLDRIREARLDGVVANEDDERAMAYELLALDQERP